MKEIFESNYNYDVVVIGAGNGGLSAAAYLAKNNKKVLVLEKHNLPGGCATSFVRGRFEFEATLHELCSVGDGLTDETSGNFRKIINKLYGVNIEWVVINELFRTISLNDNKYDVTLPANVKDFIEKMEQTVPGCYESVVNFIEMAKMIYDSINWVSNYKPVFSFYGKIKKLFKLKHFMKLVMIDTDTMLRIIGMPDKAREIIESYWIFIAVPSDSMSFAIYANMFYTYLMMKPCICHYKSHEISISMDNIIRKMNGDIWYNSPVKKIDIKNNVVYGVELTDGVYIKTKYVVANVHPHTVFLKMIDKNEIPIKERKLMNARTIAQCCLTVNLALNKSIDEIGLNGYDIFLTTTGNNRKQFEDNKTVESNHNVDIVSINNVIPDSTPKGTCSIQLSTYYPIDILEKIDKKDYFKFKNKLAERIIDDFENGIGIKIKDYIEEIVIATPETWARYINSPFGSVFGYLAQNWDGLFSRLQSIDLDKTIKNLRFVGGAGTQMDGYSSTFTNGLIQAKKVLQDLKKIK